MRIKRPSHCLSAFTHDHHSAILNNWFLILNLNFLHFLKYKTFYRQEITPYVKDRLTKNEYAYRVRKQDGVIKLNTESTSPYEGPPACSR